MSEHASLRLSRMTTARGLWRLYDGECAMLAGSGRNTYEHDSKKSGNVEVKAVLPLSPRRDWRCLTWRASYVLCIDSPVLCVLLFYV